MVAVPIRCKAGSIERACPRLSAIASFVAYRRTKRLKEADLRLELQKVAAEVEADLAALAGLLPSARKSRDAITADEYRAEQDALRGLDLDALEERLAMIYALQPRIRQLMEKYR